MILTRRSSVRKGVRPTVVFCATTSGGLGRSASWNRLQLYFQKKNMAQTTSSALRALALEYKSLQEEPVEGFRVKLVNEDNMFEWEVAIFGPPDTLYQGGYFKVIIIIIISFCSFKA